MATNTAATNQQQVLDLLITAQNLARDAKATLTQLPASMQDDHDVAMAISLLTTVQWGLIDARHRITDKTPTAQNSATATTQNDAATNAASSAGGEQ